MIKVIVRQKPGRYLQLYYVDPLTGKDRTRSTKTIDKKEAERQAALWEQELAASGPSNGPIHWDAFRLRFEQEKLAHAPPRTRHSYYNALNKLEELIGRPTDIRLITASVISQLSGKLHQRYSSKATIKNVLTHIKSALSWARKLELINSVPAFTMPAMNGSAGMHGRPITADEFERLLTACKKVRPKDWRLWQRLLRGLWLSGLRIDEAVKLSWDQPPIMVDLDTTKYPRLIFTDQKSRKAEIWPMPPDFAELLREKPTSKRTGSVFGVNHEAGRVISEIGRASKIKVNSTKYVSAHDLRRSFATRWSFRVRPIVLQRLMRHSEITTTLRYYVDQDADDISAELWQSVPPSVPPSEALGSLTDSRTTKKDRR